MDNPKIEKTIDYEPGVQEVTPITPLEFVLGQQEDDWQRGKRVRVEEVLKEHAFLRSDPSALLEMIYQEAILREEAGETPMLAEFQKRFPELAEVLRIQWEIDQVLMSRRQKRFEKSKSGSGTRAHVNAKTVGRYQILSILGKGGMGIAYKAWDPQLKRAVALKMIKGRDDVSGEDLARFRTEAAAIAQVKHPHIVQIYDVGEEAGQPFFAMEYCGGGSLAERVRKQPLPPRDAAVLVEQIARGVAAAHDEKIIHRDLKPANVLLAQWADENLEAGKASTKGKNSRTKESECSAKDVNNPSSKSSQTVVCKVTDFGLAKHLDNDDGQTRTGAIMGTPSYMAPEQAFGITKKLGPTADVYSIGAILYECLTGVPPFRGATVADTLDQVRNQDPVPIRQLQPKAPRDLETIAMKCLRKEPRRRYGGAREVADELQRYLEGRPILARPVGRLERSWRWCRRNPGVAALLALCALFVVSMLVMWGSFTMDLNTQTKIAKDNEKKANALTDIARSSEKKAIEQTKRAKAGEENMGKTVDRLLTSVAEKKLAGVPGLEELRKELYADALETLKDQMTSHDDPDPDIRRAVGQASFRSAKLLGMLNERSKEEEQLRQAEMLQRALLREDKDNPHYRADLSLTLIHVGNRVRAKDPVKAIDIAKECCALRQENVFAMPHNAEYHISLATAKESLAISFAQAGKSNLAEPTYREAINHVNAVTPPTEQSLRHLARIQSNLGKLYFRTNRPVETARMMNACVFTLEQLLKLTAHAPQHQDSLAGAFVSMGGMLFSHQDSAKAADYTLKGIKLLEGLASKYRGLPGYRSELANAHVLLVAIYADLKNGAAALEHAEKGHRFSVELARDFPQDRRLENSLAFAEMFLGRGYEANQNPAQAKKMFEAGIARAQKQLDRNSNDMQAKTILAKGYIFLADHFSVQNDAAQARIWYEKALTIANQVLRESPGNYDAQSVLNQAQGQLNNMKSKVSRDR